MLFMRIVLLLPLIVAFPPTPVDVEEAEGRRKTTSSFVSFFAESEENERGNQEKSPKTEENRADKKVEKINGNDFAQFLPSEIKVKAEDQKWGGKNIDLEGAITSGLVLTVEVAGDVSNNLIFLTSLLRASQEVREEEDEEHPGEEIKFDQKLPPVLVRFLSEGLRKKFQKNLKTLGENLPTFSSTFSISEEVLPACASKTFPKFCLLEKSPFKISAYFSSLMRALDSSHISGVHSLLRSLLYLQPKERGSLEEAFEIGAAFGHVPFSLSDRSWGGGGLDGGRWVALSEVLVWCSGCPGGVAGKVLKEASEGGSGEASWGGSEYAALTRALAVVNPPARLLTLPASYNFQAASSVGFLSHGAVVGATHSHHLFEEEFEVAPSPVKEVTLTNFQHAFDPSSHLVPRVCREAGACGILFFFVASEPTEELRRALAEIRGERSSGMWWLEVTVTIDEGEHVDTVADTIHGDWGFPWVRIVPFGKNSKVGMCIAEKGPHYSKFCFMAYYVPYEHTALIDADVYLHSAGVLYEWFSALESFDLLLLWECCGRRMEYFVKHLPPLVDPQAPFHGWEPNNGVSVYRNRKRVFDFVQEVFKEVEGKEEWYDQVTSHEQGAIPNALKRSRVRVLPLPPNHHFREWSWHYTDFGLFFMKGEGKWFAAPKSIPDWLANTPGQPLLLPKIGKLWRIEDEVRTLLKDEGGNEAGGLRGSGGEGWVERGKRMSVKGVGWVEDRLFEEKEKSMGLDMLSIFSKKVELPVISRDASSNLKEQVRWAVQGGLSSNDLSVYQGYLEGRSWREMEEVDKGDLFSSYSTASTVVLYLIAMVSLLGLSFIFGGALKKKCFKRHSAVVE